MKTIVYGRDARHPGPYSQRQSPVRWLENGWSVSRRGLYTGGIAIASPTYNCLKALCATGYARG